MKRQEWNEEQLEKLLQQLPLVKDKQTAESIYKLVQEKSEQGRKKRGWIVPAFATVAAFLLIALISPYLFQDITSSQESSMDKALTQLETEEDNRQDSIETEGEIVEAKLAQEGVSDKQEQVTLKNKGAELETFVTDQSEADEIITVGFTDGHAQNIIPVSVDTNKKQNKIENMNEIISKINTKELGLMGSELIHSTLIEEKNPQEIGIEYHGEPVLTGTNEVLYHEAIEETFRWLNYKKAKLYTENKEGIEFSNYGLKTELDLEQNSRKAYFLYQYDKETTKLLAPSQSSYDTIDMALESMSLGIEESDLKPTIMKNITTTTKENGEIIEVEFIHDYEFENNEDTIIMLESILLTAKDFGYKMVQFKGLNLNEIGLMDVTKPIEVPYSPNPIEAS